MKSHVTENVKGYRRGVVLGLTMAETMFLLVFILLLIMNGVLQSAKKEQGETSSRNCHIEEGSGARQRSLNT